MLYYVILYYRRNSRALTIGCAVSTFLLDSIRLAGPQRPGLSGRVRHLGDLTLALAAKASDTSDPPRFLRGNRQYKASISDLFSLLSVLIPSQKGAKAHLFNSHHQGSSAH